MGLLQSIKKFKKIFPLNKNKSRELNEEDEIIDDGEEDILDFGELCSDSSFLREIDEEEEEDGKSIESDEESEDILDLGESCDSSSDHQEIITEDGKSKENDEEEEEDILDLGEVSHSSPPLHEVVVMSEGGSSSKGRAQKCLLSGGRERKEEKNKASHVKKREIVFIEEEEDVLDLGDICDSSSQHEKITEDEEKEKSRQLNEEEIAVAGNKVLHVKKREVISIEEEEEEDGKHKEIDEEEFEAKKEEKIREMLYSEIQEKERAILELDRALACAKRKLKTMAEKPRSGECVSQDTSILQEEKPKKSEKRVKFALEEKEKAKGICISNEEEKIKRFVGQRVEKPGECMSYKGAGPSCVLGPQDTSTLQEEKPKKYEKRVKFTVEEKGKAEGIHISNEEKKIESQEEPKMRRISNEEDEKLEEFVTKKPTKKDHHNGVCNEEEKIKGGLDEIRPQKKSAYSEEEKINEDFAERNPKKKVDCDERRKVKRFDEGQAKKGPVSDCSFQWKELMELKGNFDDDNGDVVEFNGGEQGRNSCDYHYYNTWDNKPCDEENVHHNKNLFRYLFSFGIGVVMILRVYYGILGYLENLSRDAYWRFDEDYNM